MNRQLLRSGLAVLLVLSLTAGIALAQEDLDSVSGEPELDVYVPHPTLTPGTTSEFTIQVANDGEVRSGAVAQREMVTTARSVTVEVEDDDVPFTVETQQQSIGSVPDGGVRSVPLTVTVPEDIERDEYTLDVKLRYSHTFKFNPATGRTNEWSRTVEEEVDVTLDDSPRFELETVDSDVRIGESGTLVTELTNVGNETARDLTVSVESTSGDVTFGETINNTARVDRLAPGENTTVPYDTTVRPGVEPRNISVLGTVRFVDPAGVQHRQDGLSAGIRPGSEQEFSVSLAESTLRVGQTGTVRGTVTNEGPTDADSVALALGDAQFDAQSLRYSVGDLAAGDSATFEFRGVVPPGADAVPQQFDVTTQYQTPSDDERVSTHSLHVPVGPQQEFSVSLAESTLRVGETGAVQGTIENEGPTDVDNVVLTLGNTQFDARSPRYSVGSLAAGDSATFEFQGTVPFEADAVPQQLNVTTQYQTPNDDNRVSTHSLHVPVADRRDVVSVDATDAQFAAGEDGVLELTVTNQRESEIRDVQLTLGVAEPLESEFRTTVVPSLDAGESETVAFDVEVDGGAPATQYPATVEIAYTDDEDNRNTPRPVTVALTVTDDGVEFPTEILILTVLVVLVAAGAWWFYRRNRPSASGS